MATTTTTLQPQTEKQKGVFKKVLKYLQAQAAENSTSRSLVAPPGPEPHQRPRHKPQRTRRDQRGDFVWTSRRFSEATTAVELRPRLQRPGAMAGDGAEAGVVHETKEMMKVQFAQDNILQNYMVYVPERDPEVVQGDQYWIIYIHGGYFRDPKVDAASLKPALELLTSDDSVSHQAGSLSTVPESTTTSSINSSDTSDIDRQLVKSHIAGYASINYRLAPNPDFPQDDSTENYVKRNARFPEQLHDVHGAIRHLQTRHDFGSNYILAGHSVGATLACLAALKATEGQIDPPICILGLSGIYDFLDIHKTNPDYEMMTKNTMRPDQYEGASPALYDISNYYKILPKQTLRILLSHSRDDGLVVWDQVEIMQKALQSNDSPPVIHVELLETSGQHHVIWSEGKELARSLVKSLQMLTDY